MADFATTRLPDRFSRAKISDRRVAQGFREIFRVSAKRRVPRRTRTDLFRMRAHRLAGPLSFFAVFEAVTEAVNKAMPHSQKESTRSSTHGLVQAARACTARPLSFCAVFDVTNEEVKKSTAPIGKRIVVAQIEKRAVKWILYHWYRHRSVAVPSFFYLGELRRIISGAPDEGSRKCGL